MRLMWTPVAAVALLTFCSPGGERRGGVAGDGADQTGMGAGETATTGRGAAIDTATDTAIDTAAPGGATGGAMTDADVLSGLAVANQNEIQVAQYAVKQAQNARVKEFARTLEKDHKANLERGQALAKQLGTPPSEQAREQAAKSVEDTELAGKTGAEFDQAFVSYQVEHHQEVIDRLRNELLPAARDPQLRTFIENTIPKLEQHLATARELQNQLEG